jgi:hypothetical protein
MIIKTHSLTRVIKMRREKKRKEIENNKKIRKKMNSFPIKLSDGIYAIPPSYEDYYYPYNNSINENVISKSEKKSSNILITFLLFIYLIIFISILIVLGFKITSNYI